jgi:hypothetical protein
VWSLDITWKMMRLKNSKVGEEKDYMELNRLGRPQTG